MIESQIAKAKIGTRVFWGIDKEDQGVVADKTENALLIKWDNGDKGWIDNKGLERISIL